MNVGLERRKVMFNFLWVIIDQAQKSRVKLGFYKTNLRFDYFGSPIGKTVRPYCSLITSAIAK